MTSLTMSPFTVSLVQTATTFPIFLVALPAGALADIIDRRRLLLFTQVWMLIAALGLGVITIMGLATPIVLLVFVFLLSLGAAINGPAWQAIIPELVSREELPAAVTLGSVGFNIARAIGPAIGGLVVSLLGPGFTFLLNAISFTGVVVVLQRWRRVPLESTLPAERLIGAMRTGLRYVRNAPRVQSVFVHTLIFSVFTCALWAFLPIIARENLGLSSVGYGMLLGFFGSGALVGAYLLPKIRSMLSLNNIVAITTILMAVMMACLATVGSYALISAVMAISGMAWLILISVFSIAVQAVIPSWVRGRVLSVFMLVFFGGFAGGSMLWGALAAWMGIRQTLVGVSILLSIGIILTQKYKLPTGEDLDLTPVQQLPSHAAAKGLDSEDRPVLVVIDRRIDHERVVDFLESVRPLKMLRLRDGAIRWNLFRDVKDPSHFIESFIVESWVEYLRQHERSTVSDREIGERVDSFHSGSDPPETYHYIAEQVVKGETGFPK
jgi:predicted MFS family arabinose efflux permease